MQLATAPRPAPTAASRPTLTVLPGGKGPTSAATFRRRRIVAVLGFVSLVLGLTLLFGSGGAEAELTDRVAGHEVVEPGETLWDVAAATTPAGVDVRDQLAAIIELNGLRGGDVPIPQR
jgi:hypothetical protein